jgi:hypothetical protein
MECIMDDLTADQMEQSGHEISRFQLSDQNREIKKWHAIARMVNSYPDVLPFSLIITDPERQWAFFSQASGIIRQSKDKSIAEVTDTSEVVIDIY